MLQIKPLLSDHLFCCIKENEKNRREEGDGEKEYDTETERTIERKKRGDRRGERERI